MIRDVIIATGSINKIKKPTMPYKDPPLVNLTTSVSMDTIMITGRTPINPFFTTFLPELILPNNPSVKEPNKDGIK
jgi:hypothetical protein